MTRNTRQREAILRILRSTGAHPTADSIYEEAKREIPHISKGTVYRNLKVLQENGQVSELNLDGTESRFEAKRENHYHFKCERCGRVFDVDEPVNTKLDRKVARKTGLEISYHQLEFRGLCHDCQHQQTERKQCSRTEKSRRQISYSECGGRW
jgi:Fur family transcriptional regulator, peroxide stress response regulator